MSRTAAAAATMTLALVSLWGAVQAQTPAPAQASVVRQPADAATRASYDRADALSRSVFWSQEQQINPMDPVAGVKLLDTLAKVEAGDAIVVQLQRLQAATGKDARPLELEIGQRRFDQQHARPR